MEWSGPFEGWLSTVAWCAPMPPLATSCTTRACRVSFKRHAEPGREHGCPNCGRPLMCACHDFAPPPRRDVRRWSVVAAVLGEGLRYEGRPVCGCSRPDRGQEAQHRHRHSRSPAGGAGYRGERPGLRGWHLPARPGGRSPPHHPQGLGRRRLPPNTSSNTPPPSVSTWKLSNAPPGPGGSCRSRNAGRSSGPTAG